MNTRVFVILLLATVCQLSLGRPRYDEADDYNPDETPLDNQAERKGFSGNEDDLEASEDTDKSPSADSDNTYASQYSEEQGNEARGENSTRRSKLTSTMGKVDGETKEQFADATDEKDPVRTVEERKFKVDKGASDTGVEERRYAKKQSLAKKQLNYWTEYHPGSVWNYPYPYYHPLYSCGMVPPCGCDPDATATEAKADEPEDAPPAAPPPIPKKKPSKKTKSRKQLIPCHYYGPPSAGWGGFHPGHTGGGWGAPYWYKRQLIPCHYYGPPSAGWGGFHPGHTGGGWGAPYWYKRQLIPCHYYGPPSAGWGGFHPGHTGGGWGAPYWYKKQLVPTHYYGPPSAGWGGFQPGHSGGGWGAPYWYKSVVSTKPHKKKRKSLKKSHKKSAATGARKFYVVRNEAAGTGHGGCGGWDDGSALRLRPALGCPSTHTWNMANEHDPPSIDVVAWLGNKGPGAHGWAGHGFVAGPGFRLGNLMGANFGHGMGGGFRENLAGSWGNGFGGYPFNLGGGFGYGPPAGWNSVGNSVALGHVIGGGDFAG